MFTPCPKCGALKLKPLLLPIRLPREVSLKSLCCSDGKIDIEEEEPSPAAKFILDLLSSESDYGRVFRKHARKINNAFSLASFGATEETYRLYNPSYKVQGKTYVQIGALLPGDEQETPSFSQIYIYDADDDIQRVEVRMGYLKLGAYVSQNDRQILRDLFVYFHERIV